jgi:hypothetical protein
MRKLDDLPQDQLTSELRDAIDKARIADPIRGPSAAAKKRVRRLIRENPRSVLSTHVQANLGVHRREWIAPLIEQELAS